jgi:hypothetical protein
MNLPKPRTSQCTPPGVPVAASLLDAGALPFRGGGFEGAGPREAAGEA